MSRYGWDEEVGPEESKPVGQETDPVRTTIDAIADLHEQSERRVTTHQRGIERVTAYIGRPAFLYESLAFIAVWIAVNLLLRLSGHEPFDEPPFIWLQGIVGTTALFTATSVLIAQRRQDRVAERREQLDLQISLLIERETTKIIGLLQDLRRDLPAVPERPDPEADRLARLTNPEEIAQELDRVLDQAAALAEEADAEGEDVEGAPRASSTR